MDLTKSRQPPKGPVPRELDDLAAVVVDGAFAVHHHLGPGLERRIYRRCLVHELGKRELVAEADVSLPLVYDGRTFDLDIVLDLVVDQRILVEVVTVHRLAPLNASRMLTHLKVAGLRLGLVLNFNVAKMSQGVRRVVR
ncbi:MAG: GxxExxY protein [Candidatus Thermoplasmatota archaeon]|nr:GxxExxY protein [Candidatus Thermoplasmatota archaeon]